MPAGGEERTATIKRIQRLIALSGDSALLAAEALLRERLGEAPPHIPNPSGSKEKRSCRCGGLPPQLSGETPWPMANTSSGM